MKKTVFYYNLKQVYEEEGNYQVSVGDTVVFSVTAYEVRRVYHNFIHKQKSVHLEIIRIG